MSRVQFWAYPWPPRTNAEAQILYDHIRTVAYLLDCLPAILKLPILNQIPYYSVISRIPGLGLDALIGMAIPFVGDFIGAILGLYMVALCCLFNLPWDVIIWMLINVAVDTAIGSVPIIGDIADLFFTSNLNNLASLERHLRKGNRVEVAPKGEMPTWPDWFKVLTGERKASEFTSNFKKAR